MDYAEDLASFKPADVRLACAVWRKSDEHHMPTPGQIIAKCRSLVSPNYVPRIEPPPPPRVEKDPTVAAGLKQLMAELAANKRDWNRRPHESQVDINRRLWPNRERN